MATTTDDELLIACARLETQYTERCAKRDFINVLVDGDDLIAVVSALKSRLTSQSRDEVVQRTDTPWEVRPYADGTGRAFILGAGDETICARVKLDIAQHIVQCVNALKSPTK